MKSISNHLGEIIVALACVALLISAVTLFNAPISDFFYGIVDKEVELGETVMDGISDIDVSNIGVDGDGSSGDSSGGGAVSEVPDNVELFYTYSLDNSMNTGGYIVGLVNDFKTALNNNTDYVVDGETLWTAGSALPNPGSTYEGLPVTNMTAMFTYCTSLTTLDLSNYDTSNVLAMLGMFENCNALTSLDVSSFNTSKVTNMSGMFACCSTLTNLDISSFDTSSVTAMDFMFVECGNLTTIVARTAEDKAKIEASSNFPSGCTVNVAS